MARATNDADIIADVRQEHIQSLVSALEQEFYIEPSAVLEAVSHGASFNVIHFDTAFKVDIFVRAADAFRSDQIARRAQRNVEDTHLYLISPEDTILAKLLWYRDGGCVSERQWRDVAGVIKVQGARLDRRYLDEKAQQMGIADLLLRALTESGGFP